MASSCDEGFPFCMSNVIFREKFKKCFCLSLPVQAWNYNFFSSCYIIFCKLHATASCFLQYFALFFSVACPVELRDDSEGGIGNIADEMIRQGVVTATEQVYLFHSSLCKCPFDT